MVKIRLSARVPAPVEDVYQHVTAFGEDGLLDEEIVHERYSEDIRLDGAEYVYTEDTRIHEDDPSQIITWKCSFDYPNQRVMRAVDSNWSHRTDTFHPDRGFTHWTVMWEIQDNFFRSLIKYFAYKVGTHRSLRRLVINPVIKHFEKGFQ